MAKKELSAPETEVVSSASAPKSVFEVLNAVDCSKHVEKKNGLSYLSWAWAWQIVKKHFPDAFYTVYENDEWGINYFSDIKLKQNPDTATAWVKTGVTIQGVEYIEELPIMNFKNASIPVSQITSMDINKAIQRSLTKACARHGLGLYIYAGEDLPEEVKEQRAEEMRNARIQQATQLATNATTAEELTNIWRSFPDIHDDDNFKEVVKTRGAELKQVA